MIRKLYHGSSHIIEKPEFGQGKRYNDYGLGFYCTDSLEMAKEWGVSGDKNGYANCYELECDDLKILDLNGPEFCILHWLAILLENREFVLEELEFYIESLNAYRDAIRNTDLEKLTALLEEGKKCKEAVDG